MLKKLQMIVVLMALSVVTFAQINEDFESYNAGEQLVTQAIAQGLDYWTTWSGTPGSAEDPMVSSALGTKSVVLEGTNDAVLLLGDKTSGVFNLEFDFYVPAGKFGYFNVLQVFAGAGSEWGMQAFFDAGGVGSVDAGGEGAGSFTYSYDTWTPVKMLIDLDTDFAEMWVNGASVITWTWSGGTFGTGTINQLAAFGIFAWDENGTPGTHFDNISFEPVSSVEIFDNFEAYNAGGKLVQQALAQGITYWTCWSGDGGAGGAEDPTVTTDQANSGSNSFMIDGTNDVVIKLGDKTAGKYSYDFYMYVPTGFVGYYNMLQNWNPGGSSATWGLEVYFDPGGSGKVNAANTTPLTTFNYPYDSWIHVENIINLNTDNAVVKINGTEVASWEWSIGASGGGVNKLAAADFYAAATNGTPKFYVDDVMLTELEPAVGPSEITVTPASFSFDLEAGASTTKTLTIGNDGIAKLVWAGYPEYAMGKAANFTPVDYSNISISEVAVVETNGSASPEATDDQVILHYDGDNANAVGLTSGGSFEVGARFPVTTTNNYIGMAIYEVQVWVNDFVTASAIKIYGHGTEGQAGELLHEQAFAATIGWNNVGLNTPIDITGGDIWVALALSHDEGVFVAGCDGGPAVTNGDWFKSGAAWVPMHVANPALDANWNIRAVAEGTPTSGFMTLNPASGQIMSGETTNVTVTFDSDGLTMGTYNANIVLNSNDPVTPQKMVPVTLNVTSAVNFPVINVNPISLEFGLGYNSQETQSLNVSNVGNVNLNVNMSITYGEDALAPVTTPVEEYINVINPEQLSLANTANPTPSPNVTDDFVIRYDNGVNDDAIGLTSGGTFEVSAYWPAATMGQYAGMDLTSVEIYINDPPTSSVLKIYGQGTATVPGTLLHQQTLSVNPVAWNIIQLSTPVSITGNDIWIGYEVTHATGIYTPGCDAGPAVAGYGDMISLDGVSFEPMSALGLNYNWNIAATISGEAQVEWLSINPMSGMVTPGNMLPFDVTADTEPFDGPTDETYHASIWIASNDPATPMLEVPVTLEFPVGMRDLYSDAYMMMFPNPANNMVNLSTNYAMSNVKVVNQLGQVVLEQTPNSKTVIVNTAQLQAGIYFVKVTSEAGQSTHKLVIE